MNTFRLTLRDSVKTEHIDNVRSFTGEDASGSFGILADHSRMMTSLAFGLARYKLLDGNWHYLAMPGAMLYFIENELILNARRYIRSDNYEDISSRLTEILAAEEQSLQDIKRNLHRIEENIMRYMMEIEKPGTEL